MTNSWNAERRAKKLIYPRSDELFDFSAPSRALSLSTEYAYLADETVGHTPAEYHDDVVDSESDDDEEESESNDSLVDSDSDDDDQESESDDSLVDSIVRTRFNDNYLIEKMRKMREERERMNN